MSLAVRMPAMSRDVEVMLKDTLGPEARSRYLADFARDQLQDAQAVNKQAFGRVPPHESFVDGRASENFDQVRPDGVIAITFQLLDEVLDWIGEQLVLASPVLTGAYANSHALFVDGMDATGTPTAGTEYCFANTQPYARKIERGQSSQAPDGVYEAVAALAARRFGNIAKIIFTYRAIIEMRAVNQDLAASSGRWRRGGVGAREATGAFEATLNPGEHNRSDLRYPAILVTL